LTLWTRNATSGRFDEIFFVDLPGAPVRPDILRIHLARRGQASELARVAEAAEGFSGAEPEQIVVAALYAAHAHKADVTTRHRLGEIRDTRRQSVVMGEDIDALRQWATRRTVPCD
jgi:SpoVK/Ycf46/Vps4 family AAA+-type ATPase